MGLILIWNRIHGYELTLALGPYAGTQSLRDIYINVGDVK